MSNLVEQAIAQFGSEAKLATAAGVTQVAINKAKNAKRVSAEMAVALEKATEGKFHRSQFRPDLWPEGVAA